MVSNPAKAAVRMQQALSMCFIFNVVAVNALRRPKWECYFNVILCPRQFTFITYIFTPSLFVVIDMVHINTIIIIVLVIS